MSVPPRIVNAYADEGELVLLERVEGGIRQRRTKAEYVTWHRASEVGEDLMRGLKGCELVSRISVDGEWVRIAWYDEHSRRRGWRELERDNQVRAYEGDVDPVLLHLVESRVEIQKPRRCYFDIETDSRVAIARKEEMRILSWALVGGETGEAHRGVLAENDDASEKILLEELVALLDGYDQICVWEGSWKGGAFDSVVVPARLRKRGVPIDARRWVWTNQLAIWERMNLAESGAESESFALEAIAHEQLGEGKEHVPEFVRERFGARAAKGLGALSWDLWEAGGEFRELLSTYNVRDARLLYMLEKRKGFVAQFQAVCEICGILPENRSLSKTRQMDGLLLRMGRERGMRFGTKRFVPDGERQKFKGAYVLESCTNDPVWREARGLKNGILENVHVCDFSGMYPSIIVSWNLSYETKCPRSVYEEYRRTKVLPPNVALSPLTGLLTWTDRPGILPDAIRRLMGWRTEFSELAASLPPGTPAWQDAMAKSDAAKKTTNAFYGGTGSPDSRFFDVELAEATTQNGAYLTKRVLSDAEKRDMDPVAGDTDSAFVMGPSRDGFGVYVAWVNRSLIPALLAECGCRENIVKLAFEKTLSRLVIVKKKLYVASWAYYKGKAATETSRPEIKGLAYKRGDKGKLARELQGKVIDLLVGGGLTARGDDGKPRPVNEGLRVKRGEESVVAEDGEPVERPTADRRVFEAVIRRARDHVMLEPLPLEEVKLSKGLSKPLRDYGRDDADAHVRVARELFSRGHVVSEGVRIEYVVVDGTKSPQLVIPADDYVGECDRAHLWDRVFAPTRDLLGAAFPDVDWEKWGDVRPPKPRAAARKVLAGQLGLVFAASSTRVDELAVSTWSSRPLVVELDTDDLDVLDRVAKALRSHPGPRETEIVIRTMSGRSAIEERFRVMPGPKLEASVRAAIGDAEASITERAITRS